MAKKNQNRNVVVTDVVVETATETSATETSATETSATETSATETSATETSATETSTKKPRAPKTAQFVADATIPLHRPIIGAYKNGKPKYQTLAAPVQVCTGDKEEERQSGVDAAGNPITEKVKVPILEAWAWRPCVGKDAAGQPTEHPDPLRAGVEIPLPRMFADWLSYWQWVRDSYAASLSAYAQGKIDHYSALKPEERTVRIRKASDAKLDATNAALIAATAQLDAIKGLLGGIDLDAVASGKVTKEQLLAALMQQ